jgi:hypothetical protein
MGMTNREIISTIFKGTNAYQLGAPNPTQTGIAKSFNWIMDPMNSEWRNNVFIPNLIGLIGTQLIRSKPWVNPLAAPFKRVSASDNKAVEEIMCKLIKARAYTPKSQSNLLEYNPPEVEVALHTTNRKDTYPITFQPYEIRNAFVSGEMGLSNFLSAVLEVPTTSDNRDEYLIMLDLIAKFEEKWGFYTVEVPDMSGYNVTKDDVNILLEKIQAYAAKLSFIKPYYNAYGMETHTKPEELVLITTPEIYAKINVQSLAQAFNVSYVDIKQRVVLVDEIPIPDCYALLVDENWFVCGDTEIQSTNFFNGATLNTNYWLHHWGIYSVSPMLNAIAFRKEGATVLKTSTVTTGDFSIGLYDASGSTAASIVLGEENYLKGALEWTATPSVKGFPEEFVPTNFQIIGIETDTPASAIPAFTGTGITDVGVDEVQFALQFDDSGSYVFTYDGTNWKYNGTTAVLANYGITVEGTPAENDTITVAYTKASVTPLALNSRTYVDNFGLIHFQAAVAAGMKVTVKGTTTYNTDGVGTATDYEATATYTVTAV